MSFCGPEQEYFLVDRHFFLARPDLLNAGRTLFGTKPPKGQEFDDHYFGAIPERVLGFMMDTERELFKLGIPAKTRHNEVAPGQFEIAPMFERGNIAADHQQLLMTTFKTVAKKHGMECLFHEKPFAGVNGSGKHVNFSLGNSELGRLLVPGDTPHDNAQFLVFCAAVIRAVHKYAGLLRASVASATNDHRLGRQRGSAGDHLDLPRRPAGRRLRADRQGRRHVVEGQGHDDDRRRHAARSCRPTRATATAPARSRSPATGSSSARRAPCRPSPGRWSRINTIMAESLDYCATELETAVAAGTDFDDAVQTLLTEIITDHGAVVFNGDGYSEEWPIEAEQRGLPNLRTTLDALPELITETAMELFEQVQGLQPPRDAQPLRDRPGAVRADHRRRGPPDAGDRHDASILPAAVRHQTEIALNIGALKAAGVEPDPAPLDEVTGPLAALRAALAALQGALMDRRGRTRPLAEAEHARDALLPAMAAVRAAADTLEGIVADDLWPLPTYQEMLFIL